MRLMRLVDTIYTIPRIVLLLVLSKLAGPGLLNIIVILVALEWTNAARLARSAVLSFREQEFVLAAQCLGASRWRVMLRHLLPNALGPLIVSATLDAGAAIRAETTLSFLGLGIQPPTPSWGNLLTNAATNIFIAPLQVFLPGLFIFFALMSFNLLGDALRDALDPKMSKTTGIRNRIMDNREWKCKFAIRLNSPLSLFPLSCSHGLIVIAVRTAPSRSIATKPYNVAT